MDLLWQNVTNFIARTGVFRYVPPARNAITELRSIIYAQPLQIIRSVATSANLTPNFLLSLPLNHERENRQSLAMLD